MTAAISSIDPRDRQIIYSFLYLQALDVLTTLIFLHLGVSEGNPFMIRMISLCGYWVGVPLSKSIAIAVVGTCIWRRSYRSMRWSTIGYAGIVVWNLATMLMTVAK